MKIGHFVNNNIELSPRSSTEYTFLFVLNSQIRKQQQNGSFVLK